MQHMLIDLIGGRQRVDDRDRQARHRPVVVDPRDHHAKFIATDTTAKAGTATDMAQALRHLAEQLVADLMAQAVIDRLEPVEIEHQERAAGPAIAGVGHRLIQRIAQMGAVGQAGERVEPRQLGDLVGRFPLDGDVRPDTAKALEIAIVIIAGRGRQFEPARAPLHIDGQRQIAEALPPLEMIRQAMQAGGEAAAFPSGPGQNLDQRRPFQRLRRHADAFGETLGYAADPAQRIGLPQPVGCALLIFAQQQADDFGLLGQLDRGAVLAREGAGIDEAADQQRQCIAGGERPQRQQGFAIEHRRQADNAGDQESDRGQRRRRIADCAAHHDAADEGPERHQMLGPLSPRKKRHAGRPDQAVQQAGQGMAAQVARLRHAACADLPAMDQQGTDGNGADQRDAPADHDGRRNMTTEHAPEEQQAEHVHRQTQQRDAVCRLQLGSQDAHIGFIDEACEPHHRP